MICNYIKPALAASLLLVCANLTLAADGKPGIATETKAISMPKAADGKPKAGAAKGARKVKLVDINGAGKAELKTLPGIVDAEADKIVAGRPYLSKANLFTHGVLPRATYEKIKDLVVAKQAKATTGKIGGKEKAR